MDVRRGGRLYAVVDVGGGNCKWKVEVKVSRLDQYPHEIRIKIYRLVEHIDPSLLTWTGKRILGKECDISEIRIKISTSLQFIRFPVELNDYKLNLANVGLLVKKVNDEFHESIYILSHLSCKLLIGPLVKNLYLKKKSYSMFVVAHNSVK